MITAAFQRYLNKDYRHNAFVGNFQYKKNTVSPTCLYTSSPFVGTVLHNKVYNYFEEVELRKRMEQQRCEKIFVELTSNKDDWVNVTLKTE